MTFTDRVLLCVEVSSLKNFTVWDYVVQMCGLLGSQLLSQVQVELKEYMQKNQDRAPISQAAVTGTIDDATCRAPVMEALMSEWRINRRVRKLTNMLKREIVKRQADEQSVPSFSTAWAYQDFPSLLSQTQAETLPLSLLCDHVLNRYDLSKDKDFRDIHRDVESELLRQRNGNRTTMGFCKTNIQDPPMLTFCPPNWNTGNWSTQVHALPIRADWFRRYERPQGYTDVPLFGPMADTRARQQSRAINYPRHQIETHRRDPSVGKSGYGTDRHSRPTTTSTNYSRCHTEQNIQRQAPTVGHSRCDHAKDTHNRPMDTTNCVRRHGDQEVQKPVPACPSKTTTSVNKRPNGPTVQRHSSTVSTQRSSTNTTPHQTSTHSCDSRKSVKAHIIAAEQTFIPLGSRKATEPRSKVTATNNSKIRTHNSGEPKTSTKSHVNEPYRNLGSKSKDKVTSFADALCSADPSTVSKPKSTSNHANDKCVESKTKSTVPETGLITKAVSHVEKIATSTDSCSPDVKLSNKCTPEYSSTRSDGLVLKIVKKPKRTQVDLSSEKAIRAILREATEDPSQLAGAGYLVQRYKLMGRNQQPTVECQTGRPTVLGLCTKQDSVHLCDMYISSDLEHAQYDISMASQKYGLPLSVQDTKIKSADVQAKKDDNITERSRQAFATHVARFQNKFKGASKGEPRVVKGTSRKRKAPGTSQCDNVQIKGVQLGADSIVKTHKGVTSRKRKASSSASLCTSIQTKCARLDTDSVTKALKRHVVKRQH